jgi:hypothetical protein
MRSKAATWAASFSIGRGPDAAHGEGLEPCHLAQRRERIDLDAAPRRIPTGRSRDAEMTQRGQTRNRLQRRQVRRVIDDEAFELPQARDAPQRPGLDGVEAEDAEVGKVGEEPEIVAGGAVQAQHPKAAQRGDSAWFLRPPSPAHRPSSLAKSAIRASILGVVAQAKTRAAAAGSASRSSIHDALSKAKP